VSDQEPSLPENATPEDPVIGIVCALHLESAPFLRRIEEIRSDSGNGFTFRGCRQDGTRICLVEGGTGLTRARQATHALIDAFQPPWILSIGFSGALVDDVKLGHIVVANSVGDATGAKKLAIDLKMKAAPEKGLHVGPIVATDQIVRLVSEKRELAQRTGAFAVDMESLGVAEVCRERRVPFMAVRVITDDLTEDLPPEVLAILGPKGTVRAGALVGSILKRPGCVKDLMKMRENAQKAATRLGAFLPGVVEGLAKTLKTTA
jgi:Nucleoside phosphorylase